MKKANEWTRWNPETPADVKYADKEQFVENLGWLLSQTIKHVSQCHLKDEDTVIIELDDGDTIEANIAMDNYNAIVKDVCKYL